MTLDTGPFCVSCQIHRVQAAGGTCPGCLDDKLREGKR